MLIYEVINYKLFILEKRKIGFNRQLFMTFNSQKRMALEKPIILKLKLLFIYISLTINWLLLITLNNKFFLFPRDIF